MNLTPNFTLQEMTISQTAERHGIDNSSKQRANHQFKAGLYGARGCKGDDQQSQ